MPLSERLYSSPTITRASDIPVPVAASAKCDDGVADRDGCENAPIQTQTQPLHGELFSTMNAPHK